ncbi:WAT1-related protein At5g07050-like [Nymphaea colorata]|nr:WAT1-related protein At5g07050-like [Nymphaea colorata]
MSIMGSGGRAWRSLGSAFMGGMMAYIAMISVQVGYAGLNIITIISLKQGMSHYTLVVYRHAVATLVMAPFAIVLERKVRPKITLSIFLQMFALGLLGPVIDQNLYYAGMKYTSTTFASAMCNVLPALAFVMAVLCRMETVEIKKLRSQAKIIGTAVTLAGAMVMTLYRGPMVDSLWSGQRRQSQLGPTGPATRDGGTSGDADTDWVKGGIMVISACFSWAAFFVLQAFTLKRYSAPLSLTALICFIGTVQAAVLTLVMERRAGASAWALGWDNKLLTAVYSGTVCSGVTYYVQGLVMKQRGPVFATAFSPLFLVIQVAMSSPILHEPIFLGGIIGGVVIVVGLYVVLWGKSMEYVRPVMPAAGENEPDPEALAASAKAGKSSGATGDGDLMEVPPVAALPNCDCRAEADSSYAAK